MNQINLGNIKDIRRESEKKLKKGGIIKSFLFTWFTAFLLINLSLTTAYGENLKINSDGKVSVELINSDALFHNTLSLVSPSNVAKEFSGCNLETGQPSLPGLNLLSEKTAQHGCRVDLDSDPNTAGIQGFASGTVFEFDMLANTASGFFIWSSDPTKNSDNFDHVKTTQLHPPDDIYQLAWEDLPADQSDKDFNDLIAVVRVDKDSDGDGLWDDWETSGIDTNGDGSVDLDLPALGANPNHKDIFLEIDYMDCTVPGGDCGNDTHTHRPLSGAIQEVVKAFHDAPVTNPDSTTGVNLHVDISNAIPHQNFLNFNDGTGIGDFDNVKADPANFGPTNPRRFAYHYVLFTHQQDPGDTSSGVSEINGNDIIVSLGGWTNNVGSVREQSGTLMHELGHNLNLLHGGGEFTNCKPNYLSNMNYLWQFGLTDVNTPTISKIDYSHNNLDPLHESTLDERVGIHDGTLLTTWVNLAGIQPFGRGDGPLDWTGNDFDHNGVINDDHPVSVDINDFPIVGCGLDITGNKTHSPGQTLNGFDDWSNLKYDFQNSNNFEDGIRPNVEEQEINYPTYLQVTLGSIAGKKWEDLNANGTQDSGEQGLAGWNISLKDQNGNIIASNVTDISGNYSFINLKAGNYIIAEDIQTGWVQTTPIGGTYAVPLSSGEHVIEKDFGNFHKGKISGGGSINSTFAVGGQYNKNEAQGNIEYQDHSQNLNVKSTQINTVATTLDKKKGTITGIAQVNGAGSYPFEVYVEDNGGPGKDTDVFKISLPTYQYSNGGVLNGGDIQIQS